MVRFLQIVAQLFYEAAGNWVGNRGSRIGAALAFYSVLSIAPLLVITIGIGSFVFGEAATRRQLMAQAEDMVGKQGAEAIASMLQAADTERGVVANVLGIAALLLGASGIFGELQDAMNQIWHVQMTSAVNPWAFLRSRFLSFAMVLGTGFLLLTSLVVSALISGAAETLGGRWPELEVLWHSLHLAVSFSVVTLLFGMIFKLLPDAKVPWRDVWFGAVLTAMLFTFGKLLIGLYIGKSGLGTGYGAAGSLVVLVVWVYYSAQILLFGAELTRVFAKHYEARIAPEDGATFVHKEVTPVEDGSQE